MKENRNVIEKFLEIMFEQKTDFTLTFRKLAESLKIKKNEIFLYF